MSGPTGPTYVPMCCDKVVSHFRSPALIQQIMRRRWILLSAISIVLGIAIAGWMDRQFVRDDYLDFERAGYNVELNQLVGLPVHDAGWLPQNQSMPPGSQGYRHAQVCAAHAKPLIDAGTTQIWTWNAQVPGRGWPFLSTRWQTYVYLEGSIQYREFYITEDGGPLDSRAGWAGNIAFHTLMVFSIGLAFFVMKPILTSRGNRSSGFPVTVSSEARISNEVPAQRRSASDSGSLET